MDILVAYATRHGSTRQVATTLAMIAREGGARVELGPSGVPSPAGRW
jgi:menaquinone-dependent protoporphyrinogen IX oxidase